MSVNITIRGLDGDGHSDAIKNYIAEHFTKIQRFIDDEAWSPVDVDLIATIRAIHAHHEFEVHIRGPHFKVIVKKEGDDIYKLITRVIDIALDDLHNYKRKLLDKHKDGSGFHRP